MLRRQVTDTSRHGYVRALLALVALLSVGLASGCGSGSDDPGTTSDPLANAQPAAYTAHGSVGQVYVTGAAVDEMLDLMDAKGHVVQSGAADDEGTLLFRKVTPATGYAVVSDDSGVRRASARVAVTAPNEPPDAEFYRRQVVNPGYGYIETRDGTKLAINVILPGPVEEGPYPTVIEYSGYDPANPDAPQPSSQIVGFLGYAAVGINIRGSGCSGGAFDFFEMLQSTDGYDAVEIIAAQPWVKGHKVGMVGISYPGISQLFVARLRPPHLAAIAPLSVISDSGRGVLYPGGVLNNGFALDFARDRQHDAQPFGQPWSRKRMEEGDQTCIDNQKLRGQSVDLLKTIADNDFYDPAVADGVAPVTFVDQITAPVFLAGAWQDEQTGSYFATMIERFTRAEHAHFTMINGTHVDPLGPAIFPRWVEFLSFYVRDEIPRYPESVRLLLTGIAEQIFGPGRFRVEPERFTDAASFEEALARYEAEPRIRVLFDNGAAATPGFPVPTFEQSFPAWPIPTVEPTIWYFDAGGQLSAEPPTGDGADQYLYDPTNGQRTTFDGSTEASWTSLPAWHWLPLEDGKAVSYATEPLSEPVVMAGSGSVDLWLQSTASDTDLQVTLSEIRPDGLETFVQAGWLRASHRKLDSAASSLLRPVQTHRRADAAPLPPGEFVEARVELFPFAHAFRAGSRIRISINTPGGSRPHWKFAVLPAAGTVTNTIGRSAAAPSRVVLPVVPGIAVTTPLPPCPALRGQPCREYVGN